MKIKKIRRILLKYEYYLKYLILKELQYNVFMLLLFFFLNLYLCTCYINNYFKNHVLNSIITNYCIHKLSIRYQSKQ